MKRARSAAACALLLGTAGLAAAQPAGLGRRIAAEGLPASNVAACATCHGARGEGMAAANFPRLAGQSGGYLLRQMQNFVDGSRPHPVMTPIARGLTREQAQAVTDFYAALPAVPGGTAAPVPPGAAERGRRLAETGDDALQVQACANCHGPGGRGEPPVFPMLAGQHAGYLRAALAQWKSGERRNDASGQMQAIAARLGEADLDALAAHYAALPAAAAPAGRAAAPAPAAGKAPAAPVQGGPRDGAGAQGVGTEGGAPLTGGSQGNSGGGGSGGIRPGAPAAPASAPGRR